MASFRKKRVLRQTLGRRAEFRNEANRGSAEGRHASSSWPQ
jgi:hypothetical protein